MTSGERDDILRGIVDVRSEDPKDEGSGAVHNPDLVYFSISARNPDIIDALTCKEASLSIFTHIRDAIADVNAKKSQGYAAVSGTAAVVRRSDDPEARIEDMPIGKKILARNDAPRSSPGYYKGAPMESREVIEAMGLGEGHNRGAAMKYIYRAGKKPGNSAIRDLCKARQYLAFEIERLALAEGSMEALDLAVADIVEKGDFEDIKKTFRRLIKAWINADGSEGT